MFLTLFTMLAVVAATGGFAIGVCFVLCGGRAHVREARTNPERFGRRLRAIAPYVGGLAAILLVNKGLQGYIERVSNTYGFEATATFHAIEGDFVSVFQTLFPEQAGLYFSGVYVVGYVVLLVFPLLLYLFAESLDPLRRLVTAYAINYAVAVVFYAAVYAYGPRNYGADSAEAASVSEPMFDLFPDITLLTAQVNTHTNVFPSLHASLSATVLLLAVATRVELPRWTVFAAFLATNVVISTMYLGIHWLVDVLAGVVLAVVSVYGASVIVARASDTTTRR